MYLTFGPLTLCFIMFICAIFIGRILPKDQDSQEIKENVFPMEET